MVNNDGDTDLTVFLRSLVKLADENVWCNGRDAAHQLTQRLTSN